jgi:hypothetical protein
MSAAALARPRLLRRPVSDAQREAARRNARQHGFYANLHLFTPEESEALREQTQYFIESFRPADPVALATFQMRRISQVEAEFAARNPGDILSLGAIDTRYELLRHRCLRRLDRLATNNEANEPGNLLNQKVAPASAGVLIHHFFPSPVPADAPPRLAEACSPLAFALQ